MGSDIPSSSLTTALNSFYPRSPCGERPTATPEQNRAYRVSIHAPRVGSDWPHPPLLRLRGCFYPRSPCGERRKLMLQRFQFLRVSIHAPRVGSDLRRTRSAPAELVSIHAPRVGSDQSTINALTGQVEFLSTLPVWGATARKGNFADSFKFLSTLPVWGATCELCGEYMDDRVSIHAPRVGSDRDNGRVGHALGVSIHAPRVGSDRPRFLRAMPAAVSIHAPRVGSDIGWQLCLQLNIGFYPRSPCGERPLTSKVIRQRWRFLSTLPVWGATLPPPAAPP